jgi:hypothetical protein
VSKWACLPAGPLERHLREGVQGGELRRDPKRIFKKEWIPCFGRDSFRGSLCLLISEMQKLRKGCEASRILY